MKPRVRSGVPQTRTQKQDKALLFLDYLHADIKVADTITSFFVRRCVYFVFFGKPMRHGPVPDRDYPIGNIPQSPLFVEEEEPSNSHVQTLHIALLSPPALDR